MAHLTLTGICKSYGAQPVLHDIDLDVPSGEFVVFVGPSGCGKSTLLRMIAGLESITSGELCVDGRRMNEVLAAKRGVAMVFQNYALYPHMTVRGNLSYGLKPFLDRRPGQLSGGQRQRVAIGRALVRDPRLFLFDEPLSNLDAALRTATRVEIARLKKSMPATTMIYVTHDQIEAMTLADRIVVMNQGRIEQVGSPLDLYHRSANRFVAGFIGSPAMNFLSPDDLTRAKAGAFEIGIRPEDLRLALADQALLRGVVEHCERLGEVTIAHVRLPRGGALLAKLPGNAEITPRDEVFLTSNPDRLHRFDPEGKRIFDPNEAPDFGNGDVPVKPFLA
jgi:ABC-type sugar transport system ATPase subunit